MEYAYSYLVRKRIYDTVYMCVCAGVNRNKIVLVCELTGREE